MIYSSRLRISFKSKRQSPLFMICIEYLENGEVVFARVILNSSYNIFMQIRREIRHQFK